MKRIEPPQLFAVGMVVMFTIGGVSGVMHTTSPHDLQQTDTYFVIAHFHYVLIGGLIFAVFGSIFHWFPKVTGAWWAPLIGVAWTAIGAINWAHEPV